VIKHEKVIEGVLIMKGDLAWGIEYQDGHSKSYGWVEPSKGDIHNPEYCKVPKDATYANSPYIRELEKGRFVNVRKTITTTLEIAAIAGI